MEYIIIGLAALFASGLTLFSGFGLGTILLPVFALFFPLDIAIGMTAVVHLLNNLFKLVFLGKHADKSVAWRFGLPAIFTAFLGAYVLLWFSDLRPIASYTLGPGTYEIQPVKLVIGFLIMIFAVMEISPKLNQLALDKRYLPLGGILSGFFGGLSGHQGALRSAFLIRLGLTKEAFIATGVVIASIVDISRLVVYSSRFTQALQQDNLGTLLVAIIAAFAGVYGGSRLLKKVTMGAVQVLVSVMLFVIALGLISGVI